MSEQLNKHKRYFKTAMPRYKQPWTSDELESIARLIHEGRSRTAIQRMTGRSWDAIRTKLHLNHQGVDMIRHDLGGCRSLWSTGQLLGLHHHTMMRLVRAEELKTTFHVRGRWKHRYVADDHLMAFLSDWRYFMEWHPNLITDLDWRIYGQQCRDAVWGRWLIPADIAIATGYHIETIRLWLREGLIPHATRRGQCWYIWSRHLDGWPPLQGQRL